MVVAGRRKSIAFFIALGAGLICVISCCMSAGCCSTGVTASCCSWACCCWPLIISGVVLNTIFLVREIRRNEQHDAFINAVTHELKTPVASIRLYLETLQTRAVDEAKRKEFYRIMLDDSDRLLATIEQVLRTGRVGAASRRLNLSRDRSAARWWKNACDARGHCTSVPPDIVRIPSRPACHHPGRSRTKLRAAVSNLIDNAVKYSGNDVKVTVETAPVDGSYVPCG